jgi:hypothetical protein
MIVLNNETSVSLFPGGHLFEAEARGGPFCFFFFLCWFHFFFCCCGICGGQRKAPPPPPPAYSFHKASGRRGLPGGEREHFALFFEEKSKK